MLKTPSKASANGVSKPSTANKSSSKAKASSSAAKPRPRAAHTTDEDDEPRVPASSRARKSSAAVSDDGEGEESISLFGAGVTLVPAPVAATPASAESQAEGEEGADAEDVTSESFLSSLLAAQTPTLVSSLTSLRSKLRELRTGGVRSLKASLRDRRLPTSEGMSFLELRTHLLLQYLQHLVLFILMRLEGARGDAAGFESRLAGVTRQLVYLRTVLEKLKPLDKKLKYQIDKMLQMAAHTTKDGIAEAGAQEDEDEGIASSMDRERVELESADIEGLAPAMPGVSTGENPLSFRPNPRALLAADAPASSGGLAESAATSEEGDGTGLYRAPRIAPTLMDVDRAAERRAASERRAQSRASHSSFLRHMRAELSERPEELRIDLDDPESRPDDEEAERREFEERNLLRLTDTRKDKARAKEKERARKNTLLGLERGQFDDFRDLERAARGGRGGRFADEHEIDPFTRQEMQMEAMARKRKGRDDDGDFGFDDPAESRFAKKRRGPNGKNPYGSKFKKGGKGKGRR